MIAVKTVVMAEIRIEGRDHRTTLTDIIPINSVISTKGMVEDTKGRVETTEGGVETTKAKVETTKDRVERDTITAGRGRTCIR